MNRILLVFWSIILFILVYTFSYGVSGKETFDHIFHYDWTQEMLDKAIMKCGHPYYVKKLWINSVENKALLICKIKGGGLQSYIYLNGQYIPYTGHIR